MVESSRTPYFDAARVLIAVGHDPASRLNMRREESASVDLTGTLDLAAKLAVLDGPHNSPRIVNYRPLTIPVNQIEQTKESADV